ncbi:MAG: formate-dependent phosphoribosylglycinamide formyltransferase, partial [Gammaproteobacteria bacterium]|nr:formate-dependent phosphoribosylglycinamide formyltransferase [Gammaproteobacteria bacterium]
IEGGIGYPCIIKPVMSSSGKGQSRIEGPDDVEAAWEYAMKAGRVNQGKVIVEGVVEFDYEITQLTVRALNINGEMATHFCAPIGHIQKDGDYVESWQPQAMSATALDESRRIAELVTGALGGKGLFGVELFVKGDEVLFSEVSPRPHDTGLVTLISQWQSEFALHARAILGLPVDTTLRNVGASAVIYGGMDEVAISFDGIEQALSVQGSEVRLFGKPESFERRRMGVAIATGGDVAEARGRARLAASKVKPVK